MVHLFCLLLFATQPAPTEKGAYRIYRAGRPLGTERFEIRRKDGRIKTTATLAYHLPGRETRETVATELQGNRPVRFIWKRGEKRVAEFRFEKEKAFLRQGGRTHTFPTRATALLANNVWHHYDLLLAVLALEPGERRTVQAFLPSAARDFQVTVVRGPDLTVGEGECKWKLRSFRLITERLLVHLWTDAENRPVLCRIPAQGVRVVREGAEPQAAAILAMPLLPEARGKLATRPVRVRNGDMTLAGVFTHPRGKGPWPAVLMISGSGTQDRNGNPGGFDLFRLLAERLVLEGIASLRLDDRGAGESSMPREPTSYEDLIADARAGLAWLRKQPDVRAVVLLGHSEGAETAILIAARDGAEGLVLMAGPAAPLDQVLREQALYAAALRRLVDAGDPRSLPLVHRRLLALVEKARSGARDKRFTDLNEYWRQHMAHDPAAAIRKVRCPILILQGERDSNVLAHHALRLAREAVAGGNQRVRLRIFPNLSHAFTPSPDTPGLDGEALNTVARGVLDTVARWVRRETTAKQ